MTELTVIHPTTGEVIDLKDTAPAALVEARDKLNELMDELAAIRQAITDELALRVDRGGERTRELDGLILKANPPTEEDYLVDVLAVRCAELVEAGVIDPELVAKLIKRPPPKPQEPRVDKRVANTLKKSGNPELVAAIAAARVITPTRRKADVIGRAVDTTAIEEEVTS